MGLRSGQNDSATEGRLRRTAVQLAGMLPENIDEARRVISLMSELAEGFLAPQPTRERKFNVIAGRTPATDAQADLSASS